MFKRALVNTDIHFGKKNNEKVFLNDCDEYIDWSIEIGKKENVDCYIHLGDWHDNRKSINIYTLSRSFENVKKIVNNFPLVIFILGNHDLSLKDDRTINSLEFFSQFNNLLLIKDIKQINDCLFVPWLVGDEHKLLKSFDLPYVFGHFEISSFKYNLNKEMPDVGRLNMDGFNPKVKYVFSGHFHIRQIKENIYGTKIVYIGNCFPHDFNDCNDRERGLMIFERDKEIKFYDWKNCPLYMNYNVNDFFKVLSQSDEKITSKTTVKINVNKDYNLDDLFFIREKLVQHGILRDMIFNFIDIEENSFTETNESLEFFTIDEIVLKGIELIESSIIDKNVLLEIYKSLN
ncbi:MAG: metallophosphoesterase [Candidatus Dojkabacteria bacterium]|nr:metallophosphoesterase [Candidatus Dojkabacteria bacterium]